MVYETPLHLRALRELALKEPNSEIEAIAAAAPPTPEDIEMVESRTKRIKAFMKRLNTHYVHTPDGPRAEEPIRLPEFASPAY